MNFNQFISQFTGIGMQLNWSALAASSPNVEIIKIDDQNQLGQFYTPWRKTGDGSYADGNCSTATPLTVDTEQFPDCIEKELNGYDKQSAPKTLCIPCYALSDGRYLVLDGNHRLVGIYRARSDFEIIAWIIKGPINRQILPDLEYWE